MGCECLNRTTRLFLEEAFEFLVEARQAAAAIQQLLLAAGPGRVRLRIDIEVQRIAGLAPGRPRGEFGAVGHEDFDGVVVGVDIGFHGLIFKSWRRAGRLVPA